MKGGNHKTFDSMNRKTAIAINALASDPITWDIVEHAWDAEYLRETVECDIDEMIERLKGYPEGYIKLIRDLIFEVFSEINWEEIWRKGEPDEDEEA